MTFSPTGKIKVVNSQYQRSKTFNRAEAGCNSFCAFASKLRSLPGPFLAFIIFFAFCASVPARAQDHGIQSLVRPGDAVVTGFSGVLNRSGAAAGVGKSNATQLLIDPDGASVRGFDVSKRGTGGATDQALAPEFLTITARQVGQVFGVAFDDATNPSNDLPSPNIYVAATSAYGLALVRTGPGGKPQRLFAGAPDAEWMDGQFGEGGGPGSIWKIDGLTGHVSLFANVMHDGKPNSGPGLGNIAYDQRTRQLYVSDRATGLIHRFNLDGTDLGTFDHGVTARAAVGLLPVPLQDKKGAIITVPAFKTADPSTWGFADARRRVWGLAVWQQRLYYSVADESQVWSVYLNDDGSFDTGSVRFELKLPDNAQLLEIADIAFTQEGDLILAQRPPTTGAPDFGALVKARPSRLLRYRAETPENTKTRSRWQFAPAEYSVGITGQFRSVTGGVALGFGYDPSGVLDIDACKAMLWVTGDALREMPRASTNAGETKMGMATGIQGVPVSLLKSKRTTPADTFVVDFDGQYPEVKETGHIGDIAIAGSCPRAVATAASTVPEAPVLGAPDMAPPAAEVIAPVPGAAAGIPQGEGAILGPPPVSETPTEPGAAPPSPSGSGQWSGPGVTPSSPGGSGQWSGPGAAPPSPGGFGQWGGPGATYDLAIDKGPPHAAQAGAPGAGALHVCAAMQPCPFIVTITNVGNARFDGPFRFTDTPKGGWSYAAVSPGWTCAPGAGSSFTCSSSLTLEPGQSASISLELNPMSGVPLEPLQGENCVEINWSQGKKDSNSGNDRSCMPVILAGGAPKIPSEVAEPGAPNVVGPDLNVRKEALASTCAPGEECWFNIIISGTQNFPFTGKFKVTDIPPEGWTFAGGGNLGLWSCEDFPFTHCTYDVSKYPGLPSRGFTTGDSLATDIHFRVPQDAKEGTYKNCVLVSFPPPATGEMSKSTKTVCANVNVGNRPKLTMTKRFDQSVCVPGAPCPFTVTIKNEGKGDYQGLLVVNDYFITGGSSYQRDSISSGDFECRGVLGQPAGLWTSAQAKPGEFSCSLAAPALPNAPKVSSFPPGSTRVIHVSGKFRPDTKLKGAENCSELEFYGSDPKELSNAEKNRLVKRFLRHKGHAVSGGSGFSASDEQILAKYKTDSSYKDSQGKPDTSGKITDDFLTSLLPKHDPDYSDAKILPGTGRFFQASCATVSFAKAGLVISKKGLPAQDFRVSGGAVGTPEAEICALDHVCPFTITVRGNSGAPYTDPVVIEDTSPNGWWTLVEHSGADWSCTGTTKFVCTHPPANLTKSKSLELKLAMKPSTAFYQAKQGQNHPWIYNCVRVRYTDTTQYQLQKREEYESCYRLRLIGSDLPDFGYVATGTGSCTPPNCSYYEFTATFRTAQQPQGSPSVDALRDYNPAGTGNCLPPNCGAAELPTAGRYQGSMSMTIKPPGGASFPQARITKAPASCSASGWSCTRSGAEFGGILTCRIANCELAPGDQVTVRVDGNVAADLKEPPPVEQTREVCGEVTFQPMSRPGSIEQKVGLETKKACVTTRILATPPEMGDLQVSTAPRSLCRIGASCVVTNTIANAGDKRFVTPANMQIQGRVDPPVSIRGLRVEPAGWSCRTTGGGRYACVRTSSQFGTAAKEQISFELAIPRNFGGDKITHSVRIVWPGAADSNPANDSAVFTTPVRAPYTPPPPVVAPKPEPRPVPPQGIVVPPKPQKPEITCIGGSILRGNQTCICRNKKVPEQIGPNAFRCVCPRGSVDVRGLCITCPTGTRWDGRRCISAKPSPAPTPPPVSCQGGAMVRGICVCPPGTRRQQYGTRAYRCIRTRPSPAPAPPTVSCRGGAVIRGICVCPSGTTRQQRGTRSYQCVPLKLQTIPGRIICPPKTKFVNGRCVPVVQ